jgi:hypothetical protein
MIETEGRHGDNGPRAAQAPFIEQLTGRGLARTEDLAEWWFALRAHDLLTGRQLS